MEAYFDNSATTIVTDSVKDIVVKTAQFVTDTAVLHVNSMQLRCYHCVLSQRVHTGKQVWKHANLVM